MHTIHTQSSVTCTQRQIHTFTFRNTHELFKEIKCFFTMWC